MANINLIKVGRYIVSAANTNHISDIKCYKSKHLLYGTYENKRLCVYVNKFHSIAFY